MATPKNVAAYIRGLEIENEIIEKYNLKHSSKKDNIRFDIDAWKFKTAISIKTQHAALKTKNLAFERWQFNDENYDKMDSWLVTGTADEYWIVVGIWIYVYDAQVLKNFILDNKDSYRLTSITDPELLRINKEQGRYYNNAKSYLVPMEQIEHLVEKQLPV